MVTRNKHSHELPPTLMTLGTWTGKMEIIGVPYSFSWHRCKLLYPLCRYAPVVYGSHGDGLEGTAHLVDAQRYRCSPRIRSMETLMRKSALHQTFLAALT